MAEITLASGSPTIAALLSQIQQHVVNPTMINRVHHQFLSEVTAGKVNLVDPTNPFVFLLECSAINTAAAVNQSLINLRKQYPYLAVTPEDLHLHMSDVDYVDRFSKPAQLNFIFALNYSDLQNKLKYDVSTDSYKAVFPRDTQIEVTGYTFTFQYPIEIKRFTNGSLQISYINDKPSPLQSLTTNIIDYEVRIDADNTKWVFFKAKLLQMKVESNNYSLTRAQGLEEKIPFEDSYYYARAYYRNDSTNNQWKELRVTYTDQVFDLMRATIVMSVYNGYVHASLPAIYSQTSLAEGDLRIDVFTTKGDVVVDMSPLSVDAFQVTPRTIDEAEKTDFVKALGNINYYVLSNEKVSGGNNGLSFFDLRKRVLYNSVGIRQLPITNVQLENYVQDLGFELVKNVDVVTNRVFMAIKSLPTPTNKKLLTPANIGISSFISNNELLSNVSGCRINTLRTTILSENLFVNDNGVLYLVDDADKETLKRLPRLDFIDKVNSNRYLYNPFYYVLDATDEEFSTRVYHLDQPVFETISFDFQNESLSAAVNTQLFDIIKTDFGYRILLTTKSGNFYKLIDQTRANVQIGFYSKGNNVLSFINGELLDVTQDEERIYGVDIHTNYDLDSEDYLCITNACTYNLTPTKTWIDLKGQFHLFHVTSDITTNYAPSSSDAMMGKFMFNKDHAVITHEKLSYVLGNRLKYLWSRSRSFLAGQEYKKYTVDIPATYTQTEYNRDPATGSIFTVLPNGNIQYNVAHNVGDAILDSQGLPVLKHRKGDTMLDQLGNPIPVNPLRVDREVDVLFVDARYLFADDADFIAYRDEASGILRNWITEQISEIQKVLLEKTVVYYYPKTTLSQVKVFLDNASEDVIDSEQSFKVTLYVKDRIYRSDTIREDLKFLTVSYLDKYIGNVSLSITDAVVNLKQLYGDNVLGVELSGLGGSDKNYQVLQLTQDYNRLCLKKKLQLTDTGKLVIGEDVDIKFVNTERLLS